MSAITTHILDVSRGRPAPDVEVSLSRREQDAWLSVGAARTDGDGRAGDFLTDRDEVPRGVYRIRFEVGPYFERSGTDAFYPYVTIVFRVEDPGEHYHVPILLGPYGFTTYRGS